MPKKLVPVIVKLSGISLSAKVNQITKEQRKNLVQLLKGMSITVTGFRPVAEAIITSGGVDISQINPKTMESKLVKGLYFAGEVIDTDAYTGGFNLQIAFSTGRLAGISAAEEILKRTNAQRLKRFLPPLTLSESLCDAAKIRSYEISIKFSHTRPDGSSCNTVYTQDIGENIAYGQQSYDDVFSAWMNSEGHKNNILKEDYTKMGVCCYVDENGVRHWAQLFIL